MRILIIKNATMAELEEALMAHDLTIIEETEHTAEAISSYLDSEEEDDAAFGLHHDHVGTTIH